MGKKDVDDRFKKFGTVSFTAITKTNDFIGYLENGNIKNSVNFPDVRMDRTEGYRLTVVNSNVPNMVSQISSALARKELKIIDMLNDFVLPGAGLSPRGRFVFREDHSIATAQRGRADSHFLRPPSRASGLPDRCDGAAAAPAGGCGHGDLQRGHR